MDNPDQKETKDTNFKRKRDDQDIHSESSYVKVEQEVGENPVVIVPPSASTLSPIHKLILVDLWSDDKQVVLEALKQVKKVCKCNDENYVEDVITFHEAGGASTIVGAMRRWYTVPEIQALGCGALANSFIDPDEDSRLRIIEAGASEAIVCAMKNYPKNRDVLMNGCRALGRLCDWKEQSRNYIVITMKGHDVILTAMKKFPNDTELQMWACYALKYLSEPEKCRAPICDSGGFHALLDTIETYKDKKMEHVIHIQANARCALKNLL
jgi:hypothetical protein